MGEIMFICFYILLVLGILYIVISESKKYQNQKKYKKGCKRNNPLVQNNTNDFWEKEREKELQEGQRIIENLKNKNSYNQKNIVTSKYIPIQDRQIEVKTNQKNYTNDKQGLKIEFLDLKYVKTLSGFDFEDYYSKQLDKFKIRNRKTPKSNDFGIDNITNEEFGVQLKNYNVNKVSIKAIQEVFSGATYYGVKPVVLTTNDFTSSALELAKKLGVELITEMDLKCIRNKNYKQRYSHKTEYYNYLRSKIGVYD